jgi:hypothetical protein
MEQRPKAVSCMCGSELYVFLHSAGEFFVVGASVSAFVLWDELHWDAGKSPEVMGS